MPSESRIEKLAKITPIMEKAMAEEDMAQFGILAYRVLGSCEQEVLYQEGVNAAEHLHYRAVEMFIQRHGIPESDADNLTEALFGFRGIATRLYSLVDKK